MPQRQPRYCRAGYEDRLRNLPAKQYRNTQQADHNGR